MDDKLLDEINDYFVRANNPSILANIKLFYELSRMNNRIYGVPKKDKNEFYTKTTLSNNKRIIEDFYKEYGINIDLDKLIQDGLVNIIFNDEKVEFGGIHYYKRNEIEVVSNGVIADSAIAVHELSHLYDMPQNEYRGDVSDLLTEALAYTFQEIFMDYMYDLGYKKDANTIKKISINNLIWLSRISERIYRLLIVYDNFSDIKKDSYGMYFNTIENYDKDIEISKKNIDMISNLISWYVLAIPLRAYMYQRFKENNGFIDNIKELQNSINTKNMFECLRIIGLNDLGTEDKKILKKYMIKDKKDNYYNL